MLDYSHKHINIVYHFPIFFFKNFLTTHLPPATTLILCCLPKLLKRAICTHCILIPSIYSFFNPFQSGFCPHLSTETVLGKVTSDLRIANSVVNTQWLILSYLTPNISSIWDSCSLCYLEALTFFAWVSWGSSLLGLPPMGSSIGCFPLVPHILSLAYPEFSLLSSLVISSVLKIQFLVFISFSHSWGHLPLLWS